MEYQIINREKGEVLVVMGGKINEDAEISLQAIADLLKDVSVVTFNFAKVFNINSLGVRAWVQFLRVVEENKTIYFEECTPDVIMQINMIPNFQSKAVIVSFFTNYVCENCSNTEKLLLTIKDLEDNSLPGKQKCPFCSEEMETEELEDEYFAFLSRS